MKKKVLVFLIIVILVLLVFIGIQLPKYNFIKKINNAFYSFRESDNLSYEIINLNEPTDEELSSQMENNGGYAYIPHNKLLVYGNQVASQTIRQDKIIQVQYTDLSTKKTYIVSNENMNYTILENSFYGKSFANLPLILGGEQLTLSDTIQMIFDIKSIANVELYGKECIKVVYNFFDKLETTWFDKETMLPIKSEIPVDNESKEYVFSTNTVTLEDVSLPDLSGYEDTAKIYNNIEN